MCRLPRRAGTVTIAFELWHALSIPLQEPLPDIYQHQPLAALRRLLADLNRLEQRYRYLLLLDEYELLDDRLLATTAEDFVTTLRGCTQQYPWLAVALVGLHALQERSASYYQPIYTWRPLKVGLMNADAIADMLQVEDDSFPVEYSLEAVARVRDLTGGQPFLMQLLGDSLVQHFNRHLRQQLDPLSPVFAAQDVDAVVADENFYQQGDAYFRGIWAQADEIPNGQHTLLLSLAPHAEGLAQSTLQQASGLDADTFAAALDALSHHDVVACCDGICLYYTAYMS